MITRLLLALAAFAAFAFPAVAQAAYDQPITTVREYFDTDGDTKIYSSGKFVELGPKGTCWTKQSSLVYWPCGYTSSTPEPAPVPEAPTVDLWKIAAPVITTLPVPGAGNLAATRKTDLYMVKAMDLYPLSGATPFTRIADVVVDYARSGVVNRWKEGKNILPANGVTIERVRWNCRDTCVNMMLDSSGTVIRDAVFRPSSSDSAYSAGIQIAGTAHDVLIERVDSSGFKTTQPSGYPNSDGAVANRGTYNLTIRNSTFNDNTDGGLDLKSANTFLDNVRAARNGRNIRLWVSGRATTIWSDSPTKGLHLWFGANAKYTIDKLVLTGAGTAIHVEAGANVTVASCDLTGWTGITRKRGAGTVTFGTGCTK